MSSSRFCAAHSSGNLLALSHFRWQRLTSDWILLMLKDTGSILRETLHSQHGLNLGDVCFCPLRRTLHMQCLSLDCLQELITEGTFMPPRSEGPPKLSRTTAILLVFQADSQHEEITDVYMGLVVCRVKSCLYAPDQILDFVKDIEVDLQGVHDALKAGGDPGKQHAFCLFVSNFGGTMSIPTDPPYCLVYPTSYVRDVKLDHFDTHNNLAGMRLHHCICCAILQYNNDKPKERANYVRSHLILPRGAQYNDRLFPAILELQNHHGPLIDSAMKEPYLMEMVGDFRVADPIFKGCYRDSLLYSDTDLCWLRQWGIHLPMFQGEIPMPPAPSYRQVRKPVATKQSPHRVAASDTPAESPKAKRSSSKSGPQRGMQLQHLNSKVPRNPPAPKSQPGVARRSLQSPAVLASAVGRLLLPPSQPGANGEIFTWKTLARLTPLFLSAPACVTASAVQRVPLVT